MGPIAPVARVTPFVRIQIRGATDFSDAGELLSTAGLHLVDAASRVLDPKDTHLRLSAALGELRNIRAALDSGIGALDGAADKIRALDGYRLLGPLNNARDDLKGRLPRVGRRAVSARDGLDALIDMLGGSGPRRFLLFSQNPDEVRPTGGYIGTYGVLTTRNGHVVARPVHVDEQLGTTPHPQAVLQPAQAALPLQLDTPPQAQTIANVNATADFSAAGRLAAQALAAGWRAARQRRDLDDAAGDGAHRRRARSGAGSRLPRDGHRAPTSSSASTSTRTSQPPPAGGGRKDFLVALVKVVMQRVLDAPASKWDPLAQGDGGRLRGARSDGMVERAGDPETRSPSARGTARSRRRRATSSTKASSSTPRRTAAVCTARSITTSCCTPTARRGSRPR